MNVTKEIAQEVIEYFGVTKKEGGLVVTGTLIPIRIGDVLEKIKYDCDKNKEKCNAMWNEDYFIDQLIPLWEDCGSFSFSIQEILDKSEWACSFVRPCIKCECGDECSNHPDYLKSPASELISFLHSLKTPTK